MQEFEFDSDKMTFIIYSNLIPWKRVEILIDFAIIITGNQAWIFNKFPSSTIERKDGIHRNLLMNIRTAISGMSPVII
jgi:hypothetical protein